MTAAARTTTRPQRRWLTAAALIGLAFVPVAAGSARLVEMSGGGVLLPEPPHSAGAPVPLVVHIVSVTVFALVGAFQFVPGTRGARARWHRVTGRIVAPAGVVAALSGLWLTVVITGADSSLLTAFRTAAGVTMAGSLALGVAAVVRGDIRQHRAWMLRGYAVGLGAGTQAFTNGLWAAVVGAPGPTATTLLMGAGWVINLVVAEWLIRRPGGRQSAVAVVPTCEPDERADVLGDPVEHGPAVDRSDEVPEQLEGHEAEQLGPGG